MKNAINNEVGMLGNMFLWLVVNLKQGVIYFIKQALPPNKSAGSVPMCYENIQITLSYLIQSINYFLVMFAMMCILKFVVQVAKKI